MSEANPITLRLGTRGSLLARMQSQLVASDLEKRHPGVQVELVIIKTTGDTITDRPLYEEGGKGLFVKELEQALLAGEVDFAVHSYKDVPVTMPLVDGSGLVIAATPQREDPRDVLATGGGDGKTLPPALVDLPAGAIIGTGSLRRQCQILCRRPDLNIQPIRGNIDTRLRKLAEGQYDAVVLAMAGLRRAGLFDAGRMRAMEVDEVVPAPGQGAIAIQCRREDERTRGFLAALHHLETELCVDAERHLVARLRGNCHSPIGALGAFKEDIFRFRAAVGAQGGGQPVLTARADGPRNEALRIVDSCYDTLYHQGVEELLGMGR